MWTELGLPVIYSTTATTIKPAPDDYKAAADNVREVGQIAAQFKLTAAFEFVRQSTFASTLPTILSITRAAAQPNVGPLFDFYHFWSGNNRLEDIDALRPGEIKHVHFQDVPDMPREMLDTTTRFIPGDGVSAARRDAAQARRQGLRRSVCRWSCSCRGSRRAIRSKSRARSGTKPKRSCVARRFSDWTTCWRATART